MVEEILEEIQDRKHRECNLMIYKVIESKSTQVSVRVEADKLKVLEIVKLLCAEVKEEDLLKVNRVGVKTSDKMRPIKVTMSSSGLVGNILRRAYLLKDTEFSISSDRTKLQRDYFMRIKEEFRARLDNNEKNIQLKFVHGIPKILSKQDERKN